MKKFYLLTISLSIGLHAFSQSGGVGVNTNSPDESASLDIAGNDKGLLIPNVSLTGDNDIATVVGAPYPERLLIYNESTVTGPNAVIPGFYFWDGTKWEKLATGSDASTDHDWYESGATAPDSINDNIYTQGNVGIGLTSPSSKLELSGGSLRLPSSGYEGSGQIQSTDLIKFANGSSAQGIYAKQISLSNSWSDNDTYSQTDGLYSKGNVRIGGSTLALFANTSNGNVGIGTALPGYSLDVAGNTRTSGDFIGRIAVEDTRTTNPGPDTYDKEAHFEFKQRAAIGVGGSGTYSGLMTIAPWGDDSGDAHHQLNFNEGGLFWRQGQPNSTSWGSWDQLMTANNVNSFVNGDNLGNHTATTNLNMTNHEIDNTTYYDVLAGNGYGLRFWQSNSYKIHMGNSSEYKLGAVSDYSIKMNMNNQTNRGWTWGVDGVTPIASLNTEGKLRLENHLEIDGNKVIDDGGGWHRSYGSTGWLNGTYGGGIYMIDGTWIRTYGDKSFYHNTGIMRTDGTFQVGSGGNRFIVNSSGNVGIGQSSPGAKLDVAGQVKITGGSPGAGKVLTSDAVGLATWEPEGKGEFNSGSVTAGNWYRIASNSGNRANADFTLRDYISGGGHSTLNFNAGISFGDASNMSVIVRNHSYYSTPTFTKVRILENSTYDPMYVEVYVARSGSVDYSIVNNLQSSGWTPIDWVAGSVPSGYTAREYEVNDLFNVGDYDDRFTILRGGNVGIGTTSPVEDLHVASNIRADGTVMWGASQSRTESRADAGLQGSAGARSGFYETSAPAPAANWPTGASGWWHLLDVRHSNSSNNYGMQFSGSFFNQDLYYRKTNNNAAQPWSKIVSGNQGATVYSSTSELTVSSNNTGSFSYTPAGAGWTPGTWQTVSGFSVTRNITSGSTVHITVTARIEGDNYNAYVPSSAYFRIVRGSTEIARTAVMMTVANYVPSSFWYYISNNLSLNIIDSGVSGNQTYTVQYWLPDEFSATESVRVAERYLNVIELAN